MVAESCGSDDFASIPTTIVNAVSLQPLSQVTAPQRMIDLALDNLGPFWHQLSTIAHSQKDMGSGCCWAVVGILWDFEDGGSRVRHRDHSLPAFPQAGGLTLNNSGEPVSGIEPLTCRLQGGRSAI